MPRAPVRSAPFGRPFQLSHHHERRQVLALGTRAAGHPATQTGRAHERPASTHLIMRRRVDDVMRRRVDDAIDEARPDDGDLVGQGVNVGNEVGHLDARLAVLSPFAVTARAERAASKQLAVDLAGALWQVSTVERAQFGFWIKQINIARPANHELEDAPPGPGRKVRRLGCQGVARNAGPRLVVLKQMRRTEQAETAAHGLEEHAPVPRNE